jgi:RHS repeat-associated protein
MTAILKSPILRRVGGAARLASRAVRSIALLTFAGVLAGSGMAQAQILEYYHLDAVGNVRVVTDQAGNVIERHDYLPFGEEINPTGSQTKRFTGKERDAETGLDYFGARYYGSKIGRFTSVDPNLDAKRALLDPQEWNRYAYGRNNPLRFVDPDGRESMTYPWGGGVTYNVGDRTMTPAPSLGTSLAVEAGIGAAFAAPLLLAAEQSALSQQRRWQRPIRGTSRLPGK